MEKDEKQEEIKILTEKLVDLYARRDIRPGYESRISDLRAISNVEEKAVKVIQLSTFQMWISKEEYDDLLDVGQYSDPLRADPSNLKDMTRLMELSDTIKNDLRALRFFNDSNILFLVFSACKNILAEVKRFTDVIGEDLVQDHDRFGKVPLTCVSRDTFGELMKTYYNESIYFELTKDWWLNEYGYLYSEDLFDRFSWSENDRDKFEEKVIKYKEPTDAKLWLKLVEKLPREGDAVRKLKVFLQGQNDARLTEKLFRELPKGTNIRSLIPEKVNQWPTPFSKFIGDRIIAMFKDIPLHEVDEKLREKVAKFNANLKRYFFLKTKTPKWILEVYAQVLVPGSIDFCSLASRLNMDHNNTENNSIASESFNFEELFNDIIFSIVRRLSYRHIVPLALTSKRIRELIMTNEYLIKRLARRYFTGISISPSDFPKKLRSREHKYYLTENINFYHLSNLKSIEMTRKDVLIVRKNEHRTIQRYKIDERLGQISCYYYSAFQKPTWMTSDNFSARLYKGKVIYSVHGNTISALKDSSTCQDVTSEFVNTKNGYFVLKKNSLIGLGYSMDLTTNQIQRYPWTTNLGTIQMHSHQGYGIEISGKNIATFDARSSSTPSTMNIRSGIVQHFAVRENEVYVVAERISVWDRRYLKRSVRAATDLNKSYSEHWGTYRPAIDLTSMKVIGQGVIWDLADLTWKFDRTLMNSRRIITDGRFCVYEQPESISVYRTSCYSYGGKDFNYVPNY